MMKSGTSRTTAGTIMVASSIMKMTFLPGKRSFANAKAAMEEVRVLKAITEKVITQLF